MIPKKKVGIDHVKSPHSRIPRSSFEPLRQDAMIPKIDPSDIAASSPVNKRMTVFQTLSARISRTSSLLAKETPKLPRDKFVMYAENWLSNPPLRSPSFNLSIFNHTGLSSPNCSLMLSTVLGFILPIPTRARAGSPGRILNRKKLKTIITASVMIAKINLLNRYLPRCIGLSGGFSLEDSGWSG